MKGVQENGLRSGHMSGNGAHAGPFQAVTVNLFDLSLCKSLRRLKASLLDCGRDGGGRRGGQQVSFCARLTMTIIKFVSGHLSCVAIISPPTLVFGFNVLLLKAKRGGGASGVFGRFRLMFTSRRCSCGTHRGDSCSSPLGKRVSESLSHFLIRQVGVRGRGGGRLSHNLRLLTARRRRPSSFLRFTPSPLPALVTFCCTHVRGTRNAAARQTSVALRP